MGNAIMYCGITSLLAWLLTMHDVTLYRSWLQATWIIPAVAVAQIGFGIFLIVTR